MFKDFKHSGRRSFLRGLGGMAPSRRKDIAKYGLLAVMAGTMSNLMSGTIAGLFVALG